MRMTLLEMVTDIMSDMDSDEVTSITDTVESEQVAATLRTVYNQMIANRMIPEQRKLIQLTTVASPAKVFLLIPDTVRNVITFKYNKIGLSETVQSYADLQYLSPEEFLKLLSTVDNTISDVTQATDPVSSIQFWVYNNKAPTYWTSFDDKYIMVDAYDVAVDTTGILGTKTWAWAQTIPVWTVSNSFVPQIDDDLFPYLLAEAKSTCFVNLKQQANAKVEQQSRQAKIGTQHGRFRTETQQKESTGTTGPDYGRSRC